MELLIGLFVIVVYLIIGGFLAGLLGWNDDDDGKIAMALFWPIIGAVLILSKIVSCSVEVGAFFPRLIRKIAFKRRK